MKADLPHPSETTLLFFHFNNLVFEDKRGFLHMLRLPHSLDGVDESLIQALDHLPEDRGLIFDRQPDTILLQWNILDRAHVRSVKGGQPLDEFIDRYACDFDQRMRELGMDRREDFYGCPIAPPVKQRPSERFTLFFGHKPAPLLAEAA